MPLIRRACSRGHRAELASRSFLVITNHDYANGNGGRRRGIVVHESVPGDLVLAVLAEYFDAAGRGNDVRRRAELPYKGKATPAGQASNGEAIREFLATAQVGMAYGYPEDGWTVVRNDDLEGAEIFGAEWRRSRLAKVDWD